MKLNITEKHIDSGRKGNCAHCPIALAVKEQFPGFDDVQVYSFEIYVGRNIFLFTNECKERAKDFILAFDGERGSNEENVHPMELEIKQFSSPRNLDCVIQ